MLPRVRKGEQVMMPEETSYLVDPNDPEGTSEAAREAATRAPGMDYEPAQPGGMGGDLGTPGSLDSALENLERQLHGGSGGQDQEGPIHIPDEVTPFMPDYAPPEPIEGDAAHAGDAIGQAIGDGAWAEATGDAGAPD
jgi:hypothetical protein